MKNITYGLLMLIVTSSFISCKKFLDVLPSSQTVNPTTIRDFQEVLNSDSLSRSQFFTLDLMTDDVDFSAPQLLVAENFYRRTYLWGPEMWYPAQLDVMYNYTYSRILQMNVILSRVESAVIDGQNTLEAKNTVISQALINRASYYLQLVNAYGPAYDANTAATDLGVPLVLTPDSYASPERARVEDIYQNIIGDLKRAVANTALPAKGRDVIHPGKAAGYGLLARAYLYRNDYTNALLYADSSLILESRLLNLTTQTFFPVQIQDLSLNPEVLLGRISTDVGFVSSFATTFIIGQSLLDSLGGTLTADRRFNTRFSAGRYSTRNYNGNTQNPQVMAFDASISVPEMMLIKAECLARSGNFQAAGLLINQIRTNRISGFSTTSRNYTASNILSYVLGERRRELCFKGGLRLFDLKRLNKEPSRSKVLVRLNAAGATLATLPVGSPRYLVPFSSAVLAANPNIVQNPR
ncbi:RagB/SusD family nutrient uptake outer membrane protein [Pedobacter sp. MC2016-14]|uniref:RagB/SusD family nutrient uptake outer membrane protein n=1 Tax=Pedobacter sp. MC2016-14 TaxID=2897327 RepID=UPI001E51A3BB|nr:RagB/SusD family nutrient uptake outer membrane protein [Pedobacter sp. MC2016-14]MCD0487801.1 RagB/SusD family nutrient uptake outer membrane protein [Pedobacter sp. MC2016-14]